MQTDPLDAAGYCQRGRERMVAGLMDEALQDFDQALTLDSHSAEAHNGRGCALLELKRLDEAQAEFDQAIRLDPKFAKPYLNRAVVWRMRGDDQQALPDLQRAVELDPEFTLARMALAACCFDQSLFQQAIDQYTLCLQVDDSDARMWAWRGRAFYRCEEYERAVSDLTQSLERDPSCVWALDVRGCAYQGLREYEQAIADHTQAIAADPTYAQSYLSRGWAWHACDQYEAAIEDFTRAVDLGHGLERALLERGQCWYALEAADKAIADFTEVLKRDPSNKDAYEWRAKAWQDVDHFEQAEADLQRVDALEAADVESETMPTIKQTTHALLETHFAPTALDDLTITERTFPTRVRADLQRAMERLLANGVELLHFCGVRKRYHHHEGINFPELLIRDRDDSVISVPPQYEQINIGDAQPVNCLKDGLWLLREGETNFAVFLEPAGHYSRNRGIRYQLAAPNRAAGTQVCTRFFDRLEQAVRESECYRGKILSLEWREEFGGTSTGINVHQLHAVARDQVILPKQTLELLERNVLRFVAQRPRLAELGLATKKGLLFYGPPGTGKTHTIHYLAGALQGHTTLLISAEQVGLLSEYMTLARLLQPSIVVIEDVDLIARERRSMRNGCEEVLLNKLLNEMDGLKQDANILFILTTNRPETLEAALASRPGRVDQAIEFPLPDADGRAKLLRLYARGAELPEELLQQAVAKTENVSASFIKELLRRAMQFHLERSDNKTLELADIDSALEELLFTGGSLNCKLLGGQAK